MTRPDRLLVSIFLARPLWNEPLEVQASQHHLSVRAKGDILHCLLLPKVVRPDSVRVTRSDNLLYVELDTQRASGHPRPIHPATDERSESCVEHPRSRTSGRESERGRPT
jgi:hypothetical protein